ncbi:DUF4158 domain-containing protein [Streptosporangium roseum]|uniref:DUF4158 domain-containing protein n=1 Tax=Streptosporangium roseum TaxID=2001 RepID=UPI001E5A08B4|nr:DUF4158 domain-containing protein [Streptosporangium roseum]
MAPSWGRGSDGCGRAIRGVRGPGPVVAGRCWREARVAAQVFADEEPERLRGFPEIGRDELFRFLTLTPADIAFVDPGRGRGPADRLGLAVALCTLSWLGFVPDKVSTAPPVAVARLADQLGVDPVELRSYGRRAKTRTEHLRLVAQSAAGARHPVLSRGPGDGSAYRPRWWGDGLATACGEAIWRCRPFSRRRRKQRLAASALLDVGTRGSCRTRAAAGRRARCPASGAAWRSPAR